MQHDAQVTISGYVGTNVEFRPGGTNGADRAMFRLATTPRFLDRRQGVWREQETVWMTVKAWRTLAQNAASSIRRGERSEERRVGKEWRARGSAEGEKRKKKEE